jgi:hypothetical protein
MHGRNTMHGRNEKYLGKKRHERLSLRNRKSVVDWIQLTQQGPVTCVSEYANEASGSIKHIDQYFDQLRIRQLFEEVYESHLSVRRHFRC